MYHLQQPESEIYIVWDVELVKEIYFGNLANSVMDLLALKNNITMRKTDNILML